jgi:hypothetical protein
MLVVVEHLTMSILVQRMLVDQEAVELVIVGVMAELSIQAVAAELLAVELIPLVAAAQE